jgi:dihydrodipicolinate synthase/N-acetylneuraminate lyase
VLEIAAEEMRDTDLVKIAGAIGPTAQATQEAALARELGYDAVLLSLGAMREKAIPEIIEHVRAVADILPVFGFYLQPSVGGLVLPFDFWRQFVEIENLAAVKIAPFNRYQTLDVLRAVAESGSDASVRIVGGLLGHWAVWTSKAVEHYALTRLSAPTAELLTLAAQVTDANAALFDPAHGFHGCIAGIHEVLRRQGLLEGRWCLDPDEDLSPGQMEEIDRVYRLYPHLVDDSFVAEHLDNWLR